MLNCNQMIAARRINFVSINIYKRQFLIIDKSITTYNTQDDSCMKNNLKYFKFEQCKDFGHYATCIGTEIFHTT